MDTKYTCFPVFCKSLIFRQIYLRRRLPSKSKSYSNIIRQLGCNALRNQALQPKLFLGVVHLASLCEYKCADLCTESVTHFAGAHTACVQWCVPQPHSMRKNAVLYSKNRHVHHSRYSVY